MILAFDGVIGACGCQKLGICIHGCRQNAIMMFYL